MNLARAAWRRSTRSDANSQCLEAALNLPGVVPVRDSKDPSGPVLVFEAAAWAAFVASMTVGKTADTPIS
ncbi:DUF397 domain-containing protein [Micromonospora sp. WMMD1102]|uniref:DUF397 domain-containing protein n=1 Tax=Micromonospora sp. WMMD1102 TaxID=3016105 RepID=UPI0024159106|nr:DUF397 domain-containing protein [Micromonospora sp. WMMD1102]MDG4789657.1 DUF397 domain-containing protein [Micromonospora sp. WMMD1102]